MARVSSGTGLLLSFCNKLALLLYLSGVPWLEHGYLSKCIYEMFPVSVIFVPFCESNTSAQVTFLPFEKRLPQNSAHN